MAIISTVSNVSYSMWARVPQEAGTGLKAGEAFKLSEMPALKDVPSKAASLPMTRIWQDAVQFDSDLRARQLAEAQQAKTTEAQSQTATLAASGLAAPNTSGLYRLATLDGQRSNQTGQGGRSLLGVNRREPQPAAAGYSAQGKWAKPAASTQARLGVVFDVDA